jgi:hypothetical protein
MTSMRLISALRFPVYDGEGKTRQDESVISTGSRRFQLANLDVQKSDVSLGYDADGVDWAKKTPCEPADFPLPHVIPASGRVARELRIKRFARPKNVYPSAPMLMARASQSGAAHDQEAPGFSRLQPGEAFTLPD